MEWIFQVLLSSDVFSMSAPPTLAPACGGGIVAADEPHTDCFIGFVFGGVQDGEGE